MQAAGGVAGARLRSSVARGGVVGLVGAVSATLGGFLLVLVAARTLGATVSGQVFAAVALFTVLVNTAKLGADTALVRFVSRLVGAGRPEQLRGLLRVALPPALAASIAVALVLGFGAGWVADLLYDDLAGSTGAAYVRALAWFVPLATLTLVLLATSRGFGTVTPFVLVEQLLKPLSRPLLLAAVVLAGGGGLAALGSWLAPVAVGLLVAVVAVGRLLSGLGPPDAASAVSAGEFWRFASPRALSGFLEILAPWVAVLLLSGLSGSVDAAVFTALARVALAGTMVLVALRLALAPHLSAAFGAGDTATVTALHRHSTTVSVLASWPFFLLAAVFAGPVLSVFGPGFAAGAWALVIVAAGQLLNVAVGNVQTLILMGGRSWWNLADTAAAVVTQTVLAVLLIPDLGVTGAGIAYSAGIVVNNVTAAAQVRLALGIPLWSRACTAAVVLVCATFLPPAVAARSLLGNSWTALGVSAVVGTATCVGVVARWPRAFAVAEGLRALRGDPDPAAATAADADPRR